MVLELIMCHRFETTIQILQILEKEIRENCPIIINRNEFLFNYTDQIKSHGINRNESNQIKSNQSQKKDYTTWVWLLWKFHEINSILFINNTLFWFRLSILLNESSGLTFWIRFGISNYHPYSLFWSTYQCHQNKDNRNYILQNR